MGWQGGKKSSARQEKARKRAVEVKERTKEHIRSGNVRTGGGARGKEEWGEQSSMFGIRVPI